MVGNDFIKNPTVPQLNEFLKSTISINMIEALMIIRFLSPHP
jgi:hypothetical protein